MINSFERFNNHAKKIFKFPAHKNDAAGEVASLTIVTT